MNMLTRFYRDDSGVTAVEYAMIASVTALALVATLPAVESSLSTIYTSLANSMGQ